MRYSIIFTAAFAATAFGTPMKRDVITETDTAIDYDYVTDIITVTAGQDAPAATTVAAVSTSAPAYHWGHHSWHHSSGGAAPSSVVTPSSYVSSSEAPAPTSSSSEAPAPSSYSAPAPSSSAPAETSTSVAAPAPSSYSAAPTSSAVASSTSAASAAVASTYQEAVVNHHNYHRANHSSPNIEWDAEMASLAAEIASGCIYQHNMSLGTYGQNIAAGVKAENISQVITDMFYNGEVNAFDGLYGQADPDMTNFESWGHFSQVVWAGSVKVGCATYDCSATGLANTGSGGISPDFTVCNYSPPGNYGGEYGSNIGDSKNSQTVTGTYGLAAGTISGDGM